MSALKRLALFIAAIAVLCCAGCAQTPSQRDLAKEFITGMLTMPYAGFADPSILYPIMTKDPVTGNTVMRPNPAWDPAVKDFYGDLVTKEIQTGNPPYDWIPSLHTRMTDNGYTYTVESMDIEPSVERHYSYKAMINVNGDGVTEKYPRGALEQLPQC